MSLLPATAFVQIEETLYSSATKYESDPQMCLLCKLNGISLWQERKLHFIDWILYWKFKVHGIILGKTDNREIKLI